jgi:ribosomal protein S18 acetylase RimI-like enzyme
MIEIREISKSDSEAYSNCLEKLINTTINLPQNAKDSFKKQWNSESINVQIGNWLFLIAADETDNIIGLILGTPTEGGVGTIIWLLVENKIQQKGIGRKLFEKAKVWYKSKGAHKIKLTVPDKSTVGFYLKQGMTLEGEHPNHWWNHNFWSMGLIL